MCKYFGEIIRKLIKGPFKHDVVKNSFWICSLYQRYVIAGKTVHSVQVKKAGRNFAKRKFVEFQEILKQNSLACRRHISLVISKF